MSTDGKGKNKLRVEVDEHNKKVASVGCQIWNIAEIHTFVVFLHFKIVANTYVSGQERKGQSGRSTRRRV